MVYIVKGYHLFNSIENIWLRRLFFNNVIELCFQVYDNLAMR